MCENKTTVNIFYNENLGKNYARKEAEFLILVPNLVVRMAFWKVLD